MQRYSGSPEYSGPQVDLHHEVAYAQRKLLAPSMEANKNLEILGIVLSEHEGCVKVTYRRKATSEPYRVM